MSSVSESSVTPLPELIHYFEVRAKLLSDYATRTWQRFNWFMTVHLGAFGLLFSSFVKLPQGDWYPLVAVVMAMTALLWSALGYEDFQQLQIVTQECKEIEIKVQDSLGGQFPTPVKKRTVLPFHHARIIYLLPLLIFSAWVGLGLFLF